MKTTLLVSLCAVLTSACPLIANERWAAVDKYNGFDEHLSFNDNLVPPGWAITFPYGGPGQNAEVTNKRYQVEQVDTYGCLEKAKTLPAGDNTLGVAFRCSVQNVGSGMGYQIHILLQDGSDFVVGLGKVGFFTNLMNVYAGNYQSLTFNQTYAPNYGVYFLTASFQDNAITFTATKKGSTIRS